MLAIASLIGLFGMPATATPPQVRTAPRPVMQNPNRPQADVQQPQAERYTTLAFTVTTGDDDLRSDSKAIAKIIYADHTDDRCILRTVDADTWENGKTYDAPPCVLRTPRTFDQLKAAKIELDYAGNGAADTTHSQDDWNVDEVRVEAENVQHVQRCLIDASKRPYLVRMTGQQNAFDLSAAPSTC
jgi:hypothetical protein